MKMWIFRTLGVSSSGNSWFPYSGVTDVVKRKCKEKARLQGYGKTPDILLSSKGLNILRDENGSWFYEPQLKIVRVFTDGTDVEVCVYRDT